MTIRNSQITLLMVSFTWGMSYVMPVDLRIAFSEVFPPDLTKWSGVPMWGVGAAMIVGAAMALFGERVILTSPRQSRLGWAMSVGAHTWLCGVYWTLAVAALASGMVETHGTAPGIISAASRPVLWWYVGNLHVGFANLPRPVFPPRKPRRRRRIRIVTEDG